jgi:hypothetical protein
VPTFRQAALMVAACVVIGAGPALLVRYLTASLSLTIVTVVFIDMPALLVADRWLDDHWARPAPRRTKG